MAKFVNFYFFFRKERKILITEKYAERKFLRKMTPDEAALQLADAYQTGNFEGLIEAFANCQKEKAPLLFADEEDQDPMMPINYLIKMDAGSGSKLALLAFAVSNGCVGIFGNFLGFPYF